MGPPCGSVVTGVDRDRESTGYSVWYFQGRVLNFNKSEARKQCFLASDWLKFETIPRKNCSEETYENLIKESGNLRYSVSLTFSSLLAMYFQVSSQF